MKKQIEREIASTRRRMLAIASLAGRNNPMYKELAEKLARLERQLELLK